MSSKTTKSQISELRFPEFRKAAAWSSIRLEKCSVPVASRVGERLLTPISISTGIGFVPQAEKFGRDFSGNQYSLYTHVRKGDFVYNKGNSLKYPQGCVYQLKEWDEVAAPNVFICFRLKRGYSSQFYGYCFEKNLHGLQLRKHVTSGARSNGLLNINKDVFFDIELPLPAPPEQKKIADCLSSIDHFITAQAKKIEALKAHKRGLMRQLFSAEGETVPHLQFPEFREAGEWEEKKARTLFANRIEEGEAGLPIYSVTMNDGMIKRSLLDRDFDDIAEPEGNKKAHKHDIAYNMMRMWQGASGVAVEDCMVSPAYVILAPQNGVHSIFFGYLFKLPRYLRMLASHSQGITLDRLRLYYKDFANILLQHPSVPEQKKIADCFSSLDDLIAVQTQKLEALKAHKKGLMQGLFPSTTVDNA